MRKAVILGVGPERGVGAHLCKRFAADGIHVGHVVIDGPIGGDKIFTRRPDIVAQIGEDALISLDGIVDAFVYLYKQPRTAWSFEVDVRTSKERW